MALRRAESGSNGKVLIPRRSDRFLDGLKDASSVTFVSHVHPDPDSLGSMMGLAHLVEACLGKPTRLTRDGLISRAENRAMVDLLDLDLIPIEKAIWVEGEAVVMVDSQPNTGRHNLPANAPLYAVIDHHDTPGDLDGVPFVDVRRTLGATCSLVTSYLMEQNISVPPDLATGLLYGIETELSGYPRGQSARRRRPALPLSAGRQGPAGPHPQRPAAAELFRVHPAGAAKLVHLRPAHHQLGQRAAAAGTGRRGGRFPDPLRGDRLGGVRRRLPGQADPVGAMPPSRTPTPARCSSRWWASCGRAGGHDRRAGGTIPLPSTSANAVEQVQSELRRRLLEALHIDECRGQRLVSRREMLQNLQG